MQIGIAGLGRMGAAMAARLMEVGHTVTVWNRTPGKAKALIEAGAKEVATPEDVAEHSEAVITMLTDADAIDHVYNGEKGLLAGDATGKLFIEMSTVRPEIPMALAKVVRASGGHFVECPVGGTTGPARQGKLFGFMGAEAEDAERAKPILDQLCRRLEHVGPVGNGALAKFTINMPLMIYYQALGEALAMARPMGLDAGAADGHHLRHLRRADDDEGARAGGRENAARRGSAGDVRSRRLRQGSAIDAGRRARRAASRCRWCR